jgi:hypothetical protein
LPRKLVYLTDNIPGDETPQKQAVMGVVRDLESYLGLTAVRLGLEDVWDVNSPEDAKGEELHDFLKDVSYASFSLDDQATKLEQVGASTFLYENYQSGAKFRDDYQKAFHEKPFVSDFVHWRW